MAPDIAAQQQDGAVAQANADGASDRRGRSRHRWGAIPSKEPTAPPKPENGAAAEEKPAKRRRKSRWEDPPAEPEQNNERALMLMPEEIVLSNGIKVIMPAALTGRGDPEVVAFHRDLLDLERKLKAGIIDIPPDGRRSPSPPPIYDSMGIRQNTREVRYKDKMMKKRSRLIEELIRRDPTYKPPADYRPEKKWRKIYIPYKEYPGYNFIGLIIGPRGNTQKRMQSETNTKIAIRGKGSLKEGAAKSEKFDHGEDEELHVLITGDRQEDVDAAAAMVERLCQPMDEEMNEHKQKQLRELAALNGTLKEETYCIICGEQGHNQLECPKKAIDVYRLPDAMQAKVEEQYARDLARMNPGQAGDADQEYKSFLAELGGTDPRAAQPFSGGGQGGMPGRDTVPDGAKLWVGNLTQATNEMSLRSLFEPYGQVVWVSIKYDGGMSRGYAFVHYNEEAQAQAAIEGLNGTIVDGRPLTIRSRNQPGGGGGDGGGGYRGGARGGVGHGGSRPEDDLPPECKLFVGNIPANVDDFVLRREFERFGALQYSRVIVDRETQRPKGFGFVTFYDPSCAAAAIAGMNQYPGFDPMKPLTVKVAADKSSRGAPGPRGGGYGGDGGGYNRAPPPQYGQHDAYGGGYYPPSAYPPPGAYDPYAGQYAHDQYYGAAAAAGYGDYYAAAGQQQYDYSAAAAAYPPLPPGQEPGAPPPPPADDGSAPPPPPLPTTADPNAPPPPPTDVGQQQQGYDYSQYGYGDYAAAYGGYGAYPPQQQGYDPNAAAPPPPGPPPPSGAYDAYGGQQPPMPPPPTTDGPGQEAAAPAVDKEYENFMKELM